MSNGIGFIGNTPEIQEGSTWVNTKNGNKIVVRNSFFENGNFMVQTTDGKMLDYNHFQNYIMVPKGDPIPKIESKSKQKPKLKSKNLGNMNQKKADIPQSVLDELEISEEVNELLNPAKAAISKVLTPENISTEELIVKKVMDSQPPINMSINISSSTIPSKQIETLVNILGVDKKYIVDYLLNQVSGLDLSTQIRNILECKILEILKSSEENAADNEVIEAKSASNRRKKTTDKLSI